MLNTYRGLATRTKNATITEIKGGAFTSYIDNQQAETVSEGINDRGQARDRIYGNTRLFMCGIDKCEGPNVCGE